MTPRAWTDFLAFIDTGGNVQQRPGGEHGDMLAPAEVAEVFADLQQRYDAGDRAALWAGIQAAARYNVPMPYWLADALLLLDNALHNTVQSAHTLLGLDDALPVGRKGRQHDRAVRIKLRQQRALWAEVTRLRAEAHAVGRRLPDTAAIGAAMKALRLHMSYGKARAMFKAQEKVQRAEAGRYLRVTAHAL